ncbi:FtsK/SpoIIIE domain-containing protein [Metasolibacillus meyeri]|uniref:FtsK/SpoIIIE domain-containing protein n=1 Tax=Metasolibacillus meyeri TaxID=1071052 RepID=UPI000D325D1A|nr:FtsK/SpoIIIE domain-containing protein [Metasolibacillus meyeri]
MLKRKNKFKKVSYFSKAPLHVHFSFLLITLFVLATVAAYVLNVFSNSPLVQLLSLVLIFMGSLFTIKQWIVTRKKYNVSPFKKLKRFIKANKLYEEEIREINTDNKNSKKEKVVVNSARFSYKKTNTDELIIRAYKKADKFSDKANTYDTLLSALFALPLYKKIDEVTHCDYVFELKPDERIILAPNKTLNNGTTIRVTEKISYDISKVSHGMTVGSTGSGKSFYIYSKILDYARMNAELYIVDPKSADLSLIKLLPEFGVKRVASEPNQIARILREVTEIMEKRYRDYFNNVSAFGKTFVDFSIPPVIVVIDEWAAFIKGADKKLREECSQYLHQLILKGRASGCFVELILQRPDTSFLEGAIRDSIGCRVALGTMSRQGYEMCFGTNDSEYKTITVKGGGYIQIDGQHISPVYFETPVLPSNFNFIEELKHIVKPISPTATSKSIEIGRRTP